MNRLMEIAFEATGRSARLAPVERVGELPQALQRLGLPQSRPTLVVIGGAAGLDEAMRRRLRPLFTDGAAPAVEAADAVMIDGGTDAGVARLAGAARAASGFAFPLLGIAPQGLVQVPGNREDTASGMALEPHHSHFLLVPGEAWGEESPWLDRAAGLLAESAPQVTLLVNGGAISRRDLDLSLRAGRPVLVIRGSGRLADEVAAWTPRHPLIEAVDASGGPPALAAALGRLLQERGHGHL